jgi:hypothetical protein
VDARTKLDHVITANFPWLLPVLTLIANPPSVILLLVPVNIPIFLVILITHALSIAAMLPAVNVNLHLLTVMTTMLVLLIVVMKQQAVLTLQLMLQIFVTITTSVLPIPVIPLSPQVAFIPQLLVVLKTAWTLQFVML